MTKKGFHTLKIGTLGNFNPREQIKCKVAGWGMTEMARHATVGEYPEKLQAVFVPIRNTKQCEEDYRRLTKARKSVTSDPKSFQISKS